MDEISKEGAARPSVSMPSLDTVDDLPDETSLQVVSAETADISFTSAASTDTLISTADVLAPESESFSSIDTPSVDPKQIIEPTQPTEENSCENEQQEDSIDDSQVEDDPSIAIDQFIKKIADEQLSSKRSVTDELDNTEKPVDQEVIDEENTSQEINKDDTDKTISESVPMEVEESDSSRVIEPNNTTEEPLPVDESAATMVSDKEVTKEPESGKKADGIVRDSEKNNVLDEIKMEVKDKESPVITNEFEDSSEVSQDPFLIAKSQEEIMKVDVLVCGACHMTFHFIEEFQDHKEGKCTGVSTLISNCENDSKAQVWGFTLWKTKHLKDAGDEVPSAWVMYQKWCKLPQQDKNAWITAGQSIQYASKIANAKVTEVKVKHTYSQKTLESDPLALESVDSNKENSEIVDDHNSSNVIKKSIVKPVKLNNDVTILPSTKNSDPNSNKAIRTTKIFSTQKQEYAVEKILAKRFNPRRKTWEYQIKWENFGSESNTWEPVSNLSHCKQMLEQFEDQLKRVKEEKAKAAGAMIKGRGRPAKPIGKSVMSSQFVPIAPKPSSSSSGGSLDLTPGRPQRNSKKKALNHMKAWCGSISDEEGGAGGIKRPHEDDDDDSDVDFEKKLKLEDFSDDSDEEYKHKVIKKEPSKSSLKAVVGTPSQQILPSNILIPDANGVVRINQKQLPALSSGVYIMSKTAGIIKLDSTTSKVATSGGQTIVKVAPKIGQTQIKIVKKDGNLTKQIIQVSPKPSNLNTVTGVNKSSTPKTYKSLAKTKPKEQTPKVNVKPRVEVRKKSPSPPPQPQSQTEKSGDEESDDGIEPLEFPEDLPIPEPESPPGEFTLDPVTGKVVGVEYGPDRPVVIKEEPARISPSDNQSANELENIVKLAAADITEDDLENGSAQMDTDPLETESDLKSPVKVEPATSNVMLRYVVKNSNSTPSSVSKNDGSILNKALTGSGALAQKSTPLVKRKVIQQKILNQSVAQLHSGTPPTRTIIRQVPMGIQSQQGNVVRTKVLTPKPRFNITPQKVTASPGTRIQRQWSGSSGPNRVQVYSNKQQVTGGVRKVGSSIIRNSNVNRPASAQKPARILQTVYRTSPKKEPFILNTSLSPSKSMGSAKPKQVINMPSLMGEDETSSVPKLTPKQTTSATATPNRSQTKTATAIGGESAIDSASEEGKSADSIASGTEGLTTADLSTFTMADSENPIYITGDDGTVYQVAGQNEQGQTILITQGADGQQQCLLVTNEVGENAAEEPAEEPESVLGMPELNADVDAMAAATPPTTAASDESVKTPLQIKTDEAETAEEVAAEGGPDQVIAQVVRAEPPSPGGTHKVVVMLPDGNLMVTQVSPEEYASLELE